MTIQVQPNPVDGNYIVILTEDGVSAQVNVAVEDVNAICKGFADINGRATYLPLNDVIGLIATTDVPEGSEGIEMDDWVTAMLEAEQDLGLNENEPEEKTEDEKPSKVAVPGSKPEEKKTPHIIDRHASEIGDKLAKDVELLATIDEYINAKEATARGPIACAFRMSKALDSDDILTMPRPGSKKDDDDVKALPANMRTWCFDVRGVGKPSWYADLSSSFPAYQNILKTIDLLQQSKGGQVRTQVKWIDAMSANEIAAEQKMYTARKSNFVGAIKLAANLLKRMAYVKEKTGLVCTFRTQKHNGTDIVMRKSALIVVSDVKTSPQRSSFFSLGTFMSVDVDMVAKTDDPFANFKSERDTKDGKQTYHVSIATVDHFNEATAELALFATNDLAMGRLYSELDKPDSDDFLLSVFETARLFEHIIAKPHLSKRYRAIVEARKAKDKTEPQQQAQAS